MKTPIYFTTKTSCFLANYRQIVLLTNHKRVLCIYLLISFVEFVITVMVNLTNEEANSCDISKFKKTTAALLIKQFILLSASAGLFLYNCVRSYFKLRNVITNRVFLLPMEGVVDIQTNFVDLIRENSIGFITCFILASRFLQRAFKKVDGIYMYDKYDLIVWAVYFTFTCFYNF